MKNPTQSPTKRNAQVDQLKPVKPGKPSDPIRPIGAIPTHASPGVALKTPWPKPQPLHPTHWPTPALGKSILKVGLDLDVHRIIATIQWDHSESATGAGFQFFRRTGGLGQADDRRRPRRLYRL